MTMHILSTPNPRPISIPVCPFRVPTLPSHQTINIAPRPSSSPSGPQPRPSK
ncbi:hypothetical protein N658DRAFT_495321 [Parathielavia hyrcaniae]|uniref:Uncharacterized protein n=1 Tax=Parathielavia hyrcaniae TaxID=113614 RepID=A0AAN6Q8E3_9PEZI|nr:hypothetical protein N658DRAFT_495321 [Parathielavia hyrcaniae]